MRMNYENLQVPVAVPERQPAYRINDPRRGCVMAGDWMKIELVTPDKPEVFQIAQILEIEPDAVVGKLVRFWAWFNEQSVDGKEPAGTIFLLNRAVQNDRFCDALIEVGWLETDGEFIQIPEFDRHNGKGAKIRAQSNRRTAKHRAKKVNKIKAIAGGNEKVTEEALQKRIPEKRREEKSTPESVAAAVSYATMESGDPV